MVRVELRQISPWAMGYRHLLMKMDWVLEVNKYKSVLQNITVMPLIDFYRTLCNLNCWIDWFPGQWNNAVSLKLLLILVRHTGDIHHIWKNSGRLLLKIIGVNYNNTVRSYLKSLMLRRACCINIGNCINNKILEMIYGLGVI